MIFLYGDINSNVYVELLNGPFINLLNKKIIVYYLFKSLYGLK
jgi:hypothetical protein